MQNRFLEVQDDLGAMQRDKYDTPPALFMEPNSIGREIPEIRMEIGDMIL